MIVNKGQIGSDQASSGQIDLIVSLKQMEVTMHPSSLYLALYVHFTLVWFSSEFLSTLNQVTQGRPKGSMHDPKGSCDVVF